MDLLLEPGSWAASGAQPLFQEFGSALEGGGGEDNVIYIQLPSRIGGQQLQHHLGAYLKCRLKPQARPTKESRSAF